MVWFESRDLGGQGTSWLDCKWRVVWAQNRRFGWRCWSFSGVTTFQTYIYYVRNPKDNIALKIAVCCLFSFPSQLRSPNILFLDLHFMVCHLWIAVTSRYTNKECPGSSTWLIWLCCLMRSTVTLSPILETFLSCFKSDGKPRQSMLTRSTDWIDMLV